MATNQPIWGEWILQRSRRVGFTRKKDLAAAVGCSHDQLTKWLQMERPPGHFRKAFDHELAASLRIDRRTLLVGWEFVDPAKIPEFISRKDAPVPWENEFPGDDEHRKKLIELAGYLRGENLAHLRAEAEKLVSAGMKEARRIYKEGEAHGVSGEELTQLIKEASGRRRKTVD